MNKKEVGMRMRKLRSSKSIEVVAKDLNISTSSLIKYERGERIPRDELKVVIARYYNSTIQDLFF